MLTSTPRALLPSVQGSTPRSQRLGSPASRGMHKYEHYSPHDIAISRHPNMHAAAGSQRAPPASIAKQVPTSTGAKPAAKVLGRAACSHAPHFEGG